MVIGFEYQPTCLYVLSLFCCCGGGGGATGVMVAVAGSEGFIGGVSGGSSGWQGSVGYIGGGDGGGTDGDGGSVCNEASHSLYCSR